MNDVGYANVGSAIETMAQPNNYVVSFNVKEPGHVQVNVKDGNTDAFADSEEVSVVIFGT